LPGYISVKPPAKYTCLIFPLFILFWAKEDEEEIGDKEKKTPMRNERESNSRSRNNERKREQNEREGRVLSRPYT
jgi:hypothetical protein